MREQTKDRSRLEHILHAMERIRRYAKDKTFGDFVADDMMCYAVVKNLEIIGEASNMLTDEFRNGHPQNSLETGERYEKLHCSRVFPSG